LLLGWLLAGCVNSSAVTGRGCPKVTTASAGSPPKHTLQLTSTFCFPRSHSCCFPPTRSVSCLSAAAAYNKKQWLGCCRLPRSACEAARGCLAAAVLSLLRVWGCCTRLRVVPCYGPSEGAWVFCSEVASQLQKGAKTQPRTALPGWAEPGWLATQLCLPTYTCSHTQPCAAGGAQPVKKFFAHPRCVPAKRAASKAFSRNPNLRAGLLRNQKAQHSASGTRRAFLQLTRCAVPGVAGGLAVWRGKVTRQPLTTVLRVFPSPIA